MPLRLPLPGRRRKEAPACNAPLETGEAIIRAQRCVLIYGRERKPGALHLTSRRLVFEADRGDARWLIVPRDEISSAGAYRLRAPGAFHLWIRTAKGEEVVFALSRRDAEAWAEAIGRAPGTDPPLLE